ncbi:MFS transporter [Archangium sp.]|uniref:MFS transporter n=1 Tax=Archangium sp. TaxID=1872627 RepID=UPI002D74D58A|nr:MFS transporter [Archangium sp.]HYO55832.1 MFS transporter [Archangium sp.]
MNIFFKVWIGQLISSLGSGITGFALSVWVFQTTGSTSLFALASLAATLPDLLLAPAAGVVADRYDRRLIILIGELGGLVCALLASWLLFTGQSNVWLICLLVAGTSVFNAFRIPAWNASISMLVPAERLNQANGMVQMSQALPMLAAPLIAGVLVGLIGVHGVILIDVASFALATVSLMLVRFPALPSREGQAKSSALAEVLEGWSYIRERAGLMGLLIFIFAVNFFTGMAQISITPLVLSVSTAAVLGTIMSVGGVGMLVGSVLMSAWKGPRRKVNGVLAFTALCGLCLASFAFFPVGPLVAIPCFFMMLCVPFLLGMYQSIWQRKVAPHLQGRVFALQGMVTRLAAPMTYLLVGPLTDNVFEPLMAPDGGLATSLGAILGVGKGRGSALLLLIEGGMLTGVAIASYLAPSIRQVEDDLPDSVAETPVAVPTP